MLINQAYQIFSNQFETGIFSCVCAPQEHKKCFHVFPILVFVYCFVWVVSLSLFMRTVTSVVYSLLIIPADCLIFPLSLYQEPFAKNNAFLSLLMFVNAFFLFVAAKSP